MNITLTADMEQFVTSQVESGRFDSESEAIKGAFEKGAIQIMREELDEKLAQSKKDVEEGRVFDADEAYYERKRQMVRDRCINNK